MNNQSKTLEDIQNTLKILREGPGLRNRFPKHVWDSIIELTKTLSLQEVCEQLQIQPAYLKRKIQQQSIPLDTLDFKEISCNTKSTHFIDTIVIELVSDSGLRAKIQGPSTCLTYLSSLFRGK